MASTPQYSIGPTNSLRSTVPFFNKVSTAQCWNRNHLTSHPTITKHISRPNFLQMPSEIIKKELKVRNGGWRVWGIDDGSCGVAPTPPPPPSVLDVVRDFHNAINARDNDKLSQLLSEDCHYEDLVFYIPFEGKEGVKRFLNSVTDAMGPNVRIAIDNMAEAEGLTATVLCHLEWKDKGMPFTSGCRFFECEEVAGGRLLIRKITGLEELPLKPGDLLLKLLKAVTTFFDLYPMAANGLLAKSHGTHEGLDKLLDMLRGRRQS
ncbi:uncharacterized protein LOC21385418 isoform X1 [Morus notabilis]|uniref:uncharacterized protein LOC21385418 isoform X1 n=1 Tax=Morus notabilis TaxID=981085 RepID=UPI000CED2774|nr:uncharacterized protein LOC21385418 isoform X1 [Morus notabilis]